MILSDNTSHHSPKIDITVKCLHQLFELQADQEPDQLAIVDRSRVLSYGEVESQSNQLARLLCRGGVKVGSRVALLLPRSPELYIAILAILKAGAAYIPLDPEYPVDRIEYILSDCAVQTIVTTAELANLKEIQVENIVRVDRSERELALESPTRLSHAEVPTSERDLSYIIYTSGSTGRPKGVEIEHRSSVNYIQVVNRSVYHITPVDRVYQGFSIAFDASVEEVWCTFAAGAALVVGSVEQTRSGVDLAQFLTQQGVTVLSCVPTLLAIMEVEVPTIRLLILGGEQCPQELATRWCNPQRRVLNTYGPTEATVVSTYQECQPDRPITIGQALPTYQVYLLDEDLQPVAPGVAGEIHIGGICLARGYVNRPDLTAEKFIPNPFASSLNPIEGNARLYKTGDLGSWTADEEIQFLGRIDGQVKLRGFRIELAEIESVMMHCAGVSAAVVAVKKMVEIDRLIAYVVPRHDGNLDLAEIWDTMRSRLPIYMVPSSIEILTDLPTLPSGKVDRKSLPAPQNFGAIIPGKTTGIAPRNPTEQSIVTAWEAIFGITGISIEAEFFNELGGHSLLAAMMVSKLREQPQFQDLAVLDVYQHPTIAQLATALTTRWQDRALEQSVSNPKVRELPPRQTLAKRNHVANIGWASVGIYLLYAIYSLPLLVPCFVFDRLAILGWRSIDAALAAGISLLSLYPALLLLSIAIKWMVIGRFKVGRYRLWSSYYWRFWFVRQTLSVIPLYPLAGSVWLNWYCQLMGAKIGRDVYLGTTEFLAFDLTEIGAGSSISADSNLLGCEIVDGWLNIDRITVGQNCYVGTRTVLGLNSQLADAAEIGDLSYLPADLIIPTGEHWVGSPARLQAVPNPSLNSGLSKAPLGLQGLLTVGYALGIIAQWLIPAIAAMPGFMLWQAIIQSPHWYLWLFPSAILGSMSFIGIFCLQVILLKQLCLGKVRPGTYPLHSSFGLRHWFIDRLMTVSLEMVPTLYSTLYLLPWLRLLGAKIGARAEISTVSHLTPDLVSIGSESFIADTVSLGATQVKQGWLQLAHTHVGSQAFVGNGALVANNTHIDDNCLIGCLSVPPTDCPILPNSAWMGSPAIYIPHRQVIDEYSAAETYQPSKNLYWQRLAIEFCRVTMPGSLHFIVLLAMEFILLNLPKYLHWSIVGLLFPLIYAAASIGSALLIVALKWSIVGRYQPGTIPLWSNFVWRTEFVTGLYEAIMVSGCLSFLLGTPFAPIILRLLGMKIGKGVYIETTDFTEFDLISIGDHVILNNGCTLQTHLFEDRVMKMERIRLERQCQLGSGAVVLYDSLLEPDVSIQPMSLIMKGERVPQATAWQGIPASRVYDR